MKETAVNPTPEQLETLACDFDRRPKGAPGFLDVAPSIRSLRRENGALVIGFDQAAAGSVAALVDAERRCCAGIGWELNVEPAPRLRITAAPAQLDLIEQVLRT
jgi:hypothetical protein